MRFTKMHGIGNDFALVDAVGSPLPAADLARLAVDVCDRHKGVGADGLIFAVPGSRTRLGMRMLNPDGSESEMCGNGVRCLALFAEERGWADGGRVDVETGAGTLRLEIVAPGQVRVDMGRARLEPGEIGMAYDRGGAFVEQPVEAGGTSFLGTAVSMGNPHLVIFVDDVRAVQLETVGPMLERLPLFPARTNVHFVGVEGPGRLTQRTWERGAGATLACGTGACAVAVAAFLTGRCGRSATVTLPGGTLEIEYAEDGRVFMTGPAVKVFEGEWPGPVSPARAAVRAGSLSS